MDNNGDAVGEVKSRLNVEDVVSQYVQLKRSGRNFKGLSPFTNEKTPSFMVSPEKQIWHDFSSGRGGDIFTFTMEMEGVDFRGALELLARQAGVELDQYQSRPDGNAKLKPRLNEAVELAAHFYQKQLTASPSALKYLINDRGFSKKTILEWRLGYAPMADRPLVDFLTKKGFSQTEIRRAGLGTERRGITSDMFRGRIIIPLADAQGRVIGFTARLLRDQPGAPKYINTPSTPLYDKSRHVYGLHMAKQAIRQTGYIVVAEGNLDVISSWQAGVANVVATAGTAITEAHLMVLKRFSGDVRLSFDSDKAGLAAAERIIPLAQKVGVELKIIDLPAGAKDPDELVRKNVKEWQKVIDDASYAVDWLIKRYQSQLDLKTASGKKSFSDVLLATVRRLTDPVEQEHYVKLIAKLTDSSAQAILSKLGKASEPVRLKKPKTLDKPINKHEAEYKRLKLHLLTIAWFETATRWLLKDIPLEIFDEKPLAAIVKFLNEKSDFEYKTKLPPALRESEDYVKIMELQYEELYSNLGVSERAHQAALAKNRLLDIYVKQRTAQLAEAMRDAEGKSLTKLIQQADQLNKLIR